MKKNKFIKYAGTGLGLLCATMSLSYGVINLEDCFEIIHGERIFSYSQKDHQEEDTQEVLNFLIDQKKNIPSIHITDCIFGDNFCTEFVKILKDNTTLECLYLLRHQIGDKGAIALAGALQGNTSLKRLYLECDKIGTAGAKKLAEALEQNTTLRQLYLFNNQIGVEGEKALKDAWIKTNRPAENLHLEVLYYL